MSPEYSPHRRRFLRQSAYGLGGLMFAAWSSASRAQPGKLPTLERSVPRCRRVIFLSMAGGPSHLETFDYKPKLAEMDGKPMPESYTKGQQIAQLQGKKLVCLGPQHPFRRWGDSGQSISTALPRIAHDLADEIAIIRSMHTDQINHDPAHTLMNTGTSQSGRPAMGSWINYALGSEADDLPGFVILTSVGGGQSQPIAARQWHSGFLPGQFQGTHFQSHGDAVLHIESPPGVPWSQQRPLIDTIKGLDRLGNEGLGDPGVEVSIAQYELAARMQESIPKILDLSREPSHILDMYGTKGGDGSFASNCLMARRLAERGVRFIQLYHRGWDHHGGVKKGVALTGKLVDQGTAALVLDLKQRGMLDDTLIVWGGEFGRTPMAQGDGRDHHIKAFSLWMAGGGIKKGFSYGTTDELGYEIVDNPVHVRDLHATILHLLGIDHERLTFKFQGLDQRLTGVEKATILRPLLA